jgi:hypothetical protein
MIVIREEFPEDIEAIFALNREAFGGSGEAELVESSLQLLTVGVTKLSEIQQTKLFNFDLFGIRIQLR